MAERPYPPTSITQHTLWTALTGDIPPLRLPAAPIAHAALDSRDVRPGDLFVALLGPNTDGHAYIGAALSNGAQAVIIEERGRETAHAAGAITVDCTRGRWALYAELPERYQPGMALAYVVDDSVQAIQKVGSFQRAHRTNSTLKVVGVTGSVGKTSTKELTANVLRQRFATHASPGNLNSEQGLPLALMGLNTTHEYAVLEMGMYGLGEIDRLCLLARPQIGIVTNVGPVHLSRLGTIERIAQAKSELVRALPSAEDGGVAILNWDDERVRNMAQLTAARILRYGLTPEADLWADEIEGMGMEGIRFRFHYRLSGAQKVESIHVKAPLLGRHSVHTALCAAAVGLLEGMGWGEIIAGLQNMAGQLRLVAVSGINGSTVIDDTYNASPASTIAALNLMADIQPTGNGRRVAVLGDMLELGSYETEGHKLVGRRAAAVVDILLTVGRLGGSIGEEALDMGLPAENLHRLPNHREAIDMLRRIVRPGDLVLVKGSRAVGMDTIVAEITGEAASVTATSQEPVDG
ncbi:MAG: UDP-N-acetylmuramoyl-tripeptide--D-alanyl-D-alanine ligase [Chloroflexota bacterium]|nr:UDP-N-acetylmuramoyl-tripeptide--D-alanyl-D-alanine ligase [Caldilinea sp.]GIK74967.1 MAG: UDP-N-acetylmuramoyl-tripeptide--D-alanyl-D-alanine ligase [Chloroflexota bacterium]